MKLNYKRTFFVGFAFLSICAFWELYDGIIPKMLENTFGLGATSVGAIMAIDNVLALFLLPIMGAFSDKVDTRIGKRIPFILVGTLLASLFILLLPIADYQGNLILFMIALGIILIAMASYRSPAVALMGAVLLPVAVRVGLPPIGVAMAMNLFGHGIALSGDFIIQGAPKLTSEAAGIPVGDVVSASIPLVVIMGIVTTVLAFWYLRKDMKKGLFKNDLQTVVVPEAQKTKNEDGKGTLSLGWRRAFAILIPVLFLLDIVAMSVLKLQGGDATALIGGTAFFILILISIVTHKKESLEKITEYTVEGFHFGFKVFGPVIPIAAFFYMGDAGIYSILGNVLPATSTGIVNDLGIALAHAVPLNTVIASITSAIVGAITGLDGSGFSGISLTGSIAKLFSTAIGYGTATLTALGQVAGIWVGGGTLIPWALLPAAAICNVNPFELARRNLKPVVIGLVITTIVAIFLL